VAGRDGVAVPEVDRLALGLALEELGDLLEREPFVSGRKR
jgi:hypothetical protein